MAKAAPQNAKAGARHVNSALLPRTAMVAGALREWRGRLLMVGDGLMVTDSDHKRFEIYPFPTPGGAGFMAVAGDRAYVVRANQVLWLDLSTLHISNPAAASPP